MIIYHGSNIMVSEPKLIQQNRFLDFGFIPQQISCNCLPTRYKRKKKEQKW